jgi:hypothetical protein
MMFAAIADPSHTPSFLYHAVQIEPPTTEQSTVADAERYCEAQECWGGGPYGDTIPKQLLCLILISYALRLYSPHFTEKKV